MVKGHPGSGAALKNCQIVTPTRLAAYARRRLAAISKQLLPLVGTAVTAVIVLLAAYFSTKTPGDVTYTVKAGDNLYAIARHFRTTSSAIAALNRLPHKNAIRPGQELAVLGPGPVPQPPPETASATVISKGPTVPMVAFSFDAGSNAGHTDQILRVLKANGVIASFGVTGVWAKKNPDLVRRIVADGHHLINHSYKHRDFTTLSSASRRKELDKTEDAVIAITGLGMKPYFRPPFGAHDLPVNADLANRGYVFNVMWTVDSRGWQGLTAAQINDHCVSWAAPGAIYIFHVGKKSQDGPALQSIIGELRARGFAIGSVADVLGH